MIGLVLVTHGRLAQELRLAMEHVVGPQPQVAAICVGPDDDREASREQVRAAVAAVRSGDDGVVVLTDMLGGTPSNLAAQVAGEGGVEVIAGVNLPLLVKLAKLRGVEPMAECVEHAVAAGRRYIGRPDDVKAAAPSGANGAGGGTANGATSGAVPGGPAAAKTGGGPRA